MYKREMPKLARISWKEEFGKLDKEYIALYRNARKEQLRKLAVELALEIDNEQWLRNVVVLMAGLQDKRLKDERDNYTLVAKGGAV